MLIVSDKILGDEEAPKVTLYQNIILACNVHSYRSIDNFPPTHVFMS